MPSWGQQGVKIIVSEPENAALLSSGQAQKREVGRHSITRKHPPLNAFGRHLPFVLAMC